MILLRSCIQKSHKEKRARKGTHFFNAHGTRVNHHATVATVTVADHQAKSLAQRLIDAMPRHELPPRLDKDPTPQEAYTIYKQEIEGRQIDTPIGLSFMPKPGHFFRFVCGKGQGKQKGYIDGYESADDALKAVERGDVTASQISGYEPARALNIRLAPDVMRDPDLVLLNFREDGSPVLEFIKRYSSARFDAYVVAGYELVKGELALFSTMPKHIKGTWLAQRRLVWTRPEIGNAALGGLQGQRTELTGKWQAHDPVTLKIMFPKIGDIVKSIKPVNYNDEIKKSGLYLIRPNRINQ